MANDATLPLPTSSAQNEGLRLLVRDVFFLEWMLIGVFDSGSRFFILDVALKSDLEFATICHL